MYNTKLRSFRSKDTDNEPKPVIERKRRRRKDEICDPSIDHEAPTIQGEAASLLRPVSQRKRVRPRNKYIRHTTNVHEVPTGYQNKIDAGRRTTYKTSRRKKNVDKVVNISDKSTEAFTSIEASEDRTLDSDKNINLLEVLKAVPSSRRETHNQSKRISRNRQTVRKRKVAEQAKSTAISQIENSDVNSVRKETTCEDFDTRSEKVRRDLAVVERTPFILYQCRGCRNHFVSEWTAMIHQNTCSSRNETNGVPCRDCGRSFYHTELSPHSERDHTADGVKVLIVTMLQAQLFKCEDCDAHFLSWSALVYHLRCQRHDINLIPCTICNIKFSMYTLIPHTEIHHDRLKFRRENFEFVVGLRRPDIPNQFTKKYLNNGGSGDSDSLERKDASPTQTQSLSNEKLYKCTGCGLHFLKQLTLYKHRQPLVDDPPVMHCSACNLIFTRKPLSKHFPLEGVSVNSKGAIPVSVPHNVEESISNKISVPMHMRCRVVIENAMRENVTRHINGKTVHESVNVMLETELQHLESIYLIAPIEYRESKAGGNKNPYLIAPIEYRKSNAGGDEDPSVKMDHGDGDIALHLPDDEAQNEHNCKLEVKSEVEEMDDGNNDEIDFPNRKQSEMSVGRYEIKNEVEDKDDFTDENRPEMNDGMYEVKEDIEDIDYASNYEMKYGRFEIEHKKENKDELQDKNRSKMIDDKSEVKEDMEDIDDGNNYEINDGRLEPEDKVEDNAEDNNDIASVLYQCHGCQNHFVSEEKALAHQNACSARDEISGVRCSVCGRSFYRGQLLPHTERDHKANGVKLRIATMTRAQLYKCEHCDAHFLSWSALKYHLRCKRHDINLIQCTICSIKFSTYTFNLHTEIHHERLGLRRGNFELVVGSLHPDIPNHFTRKVSTDASENSLDDFDSKASVDEKRPQIGRRLKKYNYRFSYQCIDAIPAESESVSRVACIV